VAFNLKHLDELTRALMLEEFDADSAVGKLYKSSYQSPTGLSKWPDLLRSALAEHDEAWLTRAASPQPYWNATYPRRNRSGGYTPASVPYTASATLSEGQFVCYYLRAVCRRAVEDGHQVRVVRMQQVSVPRTSSRALIGQLVDPAELLEDLRLNMGIESFLKIPGGPNSGIGVEIVEVEHSEVVEV
jgi:hypothetical protein